MSEGQEPRYADPVDLPRDKRAFDEFPLHKTLGLTLEEVRPGFARICLAPSSLAFGGVAGSVHGGVLAAMVDIVMLEALAKMFEPGEQAMGTADLNITYLRPALGAKVFAEATVVRKGRSLAMTEVSIIDAGGRLCAKGRTLYSLRRVEAPARS